MVILDFSCPPNFAWKQWLNLFVLTPQYLLNMPNIPHMLSLVSLIFYLLIVSLCPDSNWPSNLKSSKRDLLRCKCSLGSADPEVLYWLPLGKHTLSSLAQMPTFLPFLATTSPGSSLLHIVLKPRSLHIPDCSIVSWIHAFGWMFLWPGYMIPSSLDEPFSFQDQSLCTSLGQFLNLLLRGHSIHYSIHYNVYNVY